MIWCGDVNAVVYQGTDNSPISYFEDENNEIIGYQYLSIGKFTDFMKKGLSAEEALEKAKGQYGRYDDGVKFIDPRKE